MLFMFWLEISRIAECSMLDRLAKTWRQNLVNTFTEWKSQNLIIFFIISTNQLKWIKALQTPYPIGFNNNIASYPQGFTDNFYHQDTRNHIKCWLEKDWLCYIKYSFMLLHLLHYMDYMGCEIFPVFFFIATDKRGYPHIFLISWRKHMLWVLIRSTSPRRF